MIGWLKRKLCGEPAYEVDWLELFPNASGDWQYRIRSESNGRILSTSEAYATKTGARAEATQQAARHGYRYREVES
jgi:uncharacterized protein YegP (UPF0339 family)